MPLAATVRGACAPGPLVRATLSPSPTWTATAVDDTGRGLWNTRNGHGDAMHVGDLNPSRSGLEVFKVDEDSSKPSSWMADARTGQILWSTPAAGDNGRGVSADIWAGSPGAESWSASSGDGVRNPSGQRPEPAGRNCGQCADSGGSYAHRTAIPRRSAAWRRALSPVWGRPAPAVGPPSTPNSPRTYESVTRSRPVRRM